MTTSEQLAKQFIANAHRMYPEAVQWMRCLCKHAMAKRNFNLAKSRRRQRYWYRESIRWGRKAGKFTRIPL